MIIAGRQVLKSKKKISTLFLLFSAQNSWFSKITYYLRIMLRLVQQPLATKSIRRLKGYQHHNN